EAALRRRKPLYAPGSGLREREAALRLRKPLYAPGSGFTFQEAACATGKRLPAPGVAAGNGPAAAGHRVLICRDSHCLDDDAPEEPEVKRKAADRSRRLAVDQEGTESPVQDHGLDRFRKAHGQLSDARAGDLAARRDDGLDVDRSLEPRPFRELRIFGQRARERVAIEPGRRFAREIGRREIDALAGADRLSPGLGPMPAPEPYVDAALEPLDRLYVDAALDPRLGQMVALRLGQLAGFEVDLDRSRDVTARNRDHEPIVLVVESRRGEGRALASDPLQVPRSEEVFEREPADLGAVGPEKDQRVSRVAHTHPAPDVERDHEAPIVRDQEPAGERLAREPERRAELFAPGGGALEQRSAGLAVDPGSPFLPEQSSQVTGASEEVARRDFEDEPIVGRGVA